MTAAAEDAKSADETGGGSTASAAVSSTPQHHPMHLLDGATRFEPLKVCLDDDSSIEDGDEDMFDDDAFTFGDEDFQALMSHEAMKRISSAPVKSVQNCRSSNLASAACTAPNSLIPLHQNTSSLPDVKACITDPGVDSTPSTAASSSGKSGHHGQISLVVRAKKVEELWCPGHMRRNRYIDR